MGQITHAGAALGLGHGDAQQTQPTHFGPQVHGELVTRVDLGGAGRDFNLRKLLHGVAQGIYVLPELKIKSWQVHGGLSVGVGWALTVCPS